MQKKVVKKKQAEQQKSKAKKPNRLVINRTTGEIKSSNPPAIIAGEVEVHEAEIHDIDVVDTFKSAADLTDCDKLEFELGRLRSYLVSWITYMEFDGKLYKLMVDPMAKNIKVLEK